MKLDSPEARSVARLFNEYDPHVGLDLHTTNGTRHAYHVTYAPPLHPNTPTVIDELLRERLLPHLTNEIRQKYGWEYYYYGNAGGPGGGEPAWRTFDHRPRFNNNYVGLRNRIALLSEAYSYATFEDRVVSTLYFVEETLDYVHENAAEVRAVVAAADESVVGQTLALRAIPKRSAEPVDILMGEVDEEQHPLTGATILRRRDVSRVERMYEYGTFEASETGVVPSGYVVPAELTEIVTRLRAHGVAMETAPTTAIEVEAFQVDSVSTSERAFQGHNEQVVHGAYERRIMTPGESAVWVAADQPLGRLLFTLLEPRSDDGFANWGLMADELSPGETYPVLRVP